MKKVLFIFVIACSALTLYAGDITPISNALKTGNTDILKDKIDTEVDIAVPGTSKKTTGSDAIAILKTFFEKNEPTNFTLSHNADKNDSGFMVGKLMTKNGEFRVNITYVVKDDKIFIKIIRIE